MNNDISLTDHEMWKLIRARVDAGRSMLGIADEIGMSVDALCEWIFAYREPRPAKTYQTPMAPALAITSSPMNHEWSKSEQARRCSSWRRAKAGARVAREARIEAQ